MILHGGLARQTDLYSTSRADPITSFKIRSLCSCLPGEPLVSTTVWPLLKRTRTNDCVHIPTASKLNTSSWNSSVEAKFAIANSIPPSTIFRRSNMVFHDSISITSYTHTSIASPFSCRKKCLLASFMGEPQGLNFSKAKLPNRSSLMPIPVTRLHSVLSSLQMEG